MARKKTETTTPTNKDTTAVKAKAPRKPRATKTTQQDTEDAEPPAGKPLATIGDAVAAKRAERDIPREVEVENFTRRLPCKLSEPDVKVKLQEVKQLKVQIEHETEVLAQLKLDFETAKKTFEGAKSSCEGRISEKTHAREELIAQTCDGIEYRDTACQRVKDYQAISVSEYRIDTTPKELLQAPRSMTPKEVQMPTLDNLQPRDVATQPARSFEDVSQRDNTDHAEPEEDDDNDDEVEFD